MNGSLFAYGTLMVPRIWRAVTGRDHPHEPATLPGYEIRRVAGAEYPAIIPATRPGEKVEGLLYHDVDDETLRRLDEYEGDLYLRSDVTLLDRRSNPVSSQAYITAPSQVSRLSGENWCFEHFLAHAEPGYFERVRAYLAGGCNVPS